MSDYNEKWEERASLAITMRNELVRDGADPDGKGVNQIEERAANCLSRAKGKK
jgi:hypothetical protein